MNELKELKELKYKLDSKEETSRYKWLVSGEKATASNDKYKPLGRHNELPKQLAENINILDINVSLNHNVLVDHASRIKNIEELYDIPENTLEQININTKNIKELSESLVDFSFDYLGSKEELSQVKTTLGKRSLNDTSHRSVLTDLFFIRSELGSYQGYDINGLEDPTSIGSGLKHKVTLALRTGAENREEIKRLDEKILDSDLGSLYDKVGNLEKSVGQIDYIGTGPVSKQLETLKVNTNNNSESIVKIKDFIGYQGVVSLVSRVSVLETNQRMIQNSLDGPTGLNNTVLDLKLKVDKFADVEVSHNELTKIVGISGSDGLRGSVASLTSKIGTRETDGSILYRLGELDLKTDTANSDIVELKTLVGSTDSGLIKSVKNIETKLSGDVDGNTEVDQIGLEAAVKNLWFDNETTVEEAPDDGYSYLRQHGEWVRARYTIGMFRTTEYESKEQFNFNEMTPAEYNSGISVSDEGKLIIDEPGIYDVDIKLDCEYTNQKLVLHINDKKHGVTTYPLKMESGTLIIADFISFFPARASLSIGLEGDTTTINELVIKVKPTF